MPELPEVETIRRDLSARILNKTIRDVAVLDLTLLTGHPLRGKLHRKLTVEDFRGRVKGRTIRNLGRRGKYIIMELADETALILHLRMTGQLLLSAPSIRERAVFEFTDGSKLWFVDRRRFGEILHTPDWRNEKCLRGLGIEPLEGELDSAFLKKAFLKRDTPIHSALLNQQILAGLGNIYVVEALHRAKIHPARKAGKISEEQRGRLAESIKNVLEESIRNRGYSMHTYVDALGKKGRSQLFSLAYGKEGKPCTFCGTLMRRKVLTGRGVVFCPSCQK